MGLKKKVNKINNFAIELITRNEYCYVKIGFI